MLRRMVSGTRKWVQKLRRNRSRCSDVSRSLARDLGVPPDVVERVLDQTAAELAAIDDAADALPIINKAIDELAEYGYHSRPYEDAMMERCLASLPERELDILRLFKQGKKHSEIAEIMGTDVESIRRSLVKSYTDLRMTMRGFDGDDGKPVKTAPEETESA